jgi:predicted permease
LLFGLVSLLLVVTCVNVAHLVSARGAARTREFAIRLAIGASRERLIRQLLTESLCLSLIGALLGIGLAALANAALVRYLSAQPSLSFHVPDWLSFHVDVNVLIFALVAATLAGLVTALAPARAAARGDLTAGLKASHRGLLRANGRRGRSWPLVTQFAVCLLLLAIAGLFVRSFQKIGEVDLGFRTNHLMQVDIDWGRSSSSDTEINQWLEEFAEDVRAIPGVEAVSMSAPGVFSRSTWQATLRVPGDRQAVTLVQVTSAAPGYFSTLGIPLRGRDFGSQDRAKSARVVILSETAARTHFPTGEAIGKQVRLFDAPDPVEVIGVAGDIRLRNVLAAPPPVAYIALAQARAPVSRFVTLVVESALPVSSLAPAFERRLRLRDPQSHASVRPVMDSVSESVLLQRLAAWVTGLFGLIALGLAAVGIYGLVSYTTATRTVEIGIRMALGATAGGVLRRTLADAMRPVFLGLIVGIAAATVTLRLASSYLFGVASYDPKVLLSAAALLASIAGIACYIPSHRASRVSPLDALRSE